LKSVLSFPQQRKYDKGENGLKDIKMEKRENTNYAELETLHGTDYLELCNHCVRYCMHHYSCDHIDKKPTHLKLRNVY